MSINTQGEATETNGFDITNNFDEADEGLTIKFRLNPMSSLDASVPSSPTKSSSLKRNTSHGQLMPAETKETRVRVIYTGGTIGMVRNERNGKYRMG